MTNHKQVETAPGDRPLRVLHIGNIANNAYKNVKLLNEAGLDCDVICYDYYHLMGTPEWEEAEIGGEIRNQNFPNWAAVNLHGYRRPPWFAQGPTRLCIRYLLARRRGQRWRAAYWWQMMVLYRLMLSNVLGLLQLSNFTMRLGRILVRALRRVVRFTRRAIHLGRRTVYLTFKRGPIWTARHFVAWMHGLPPDETGDTSPKDRKQTFLTSFQQRGNVLIEAFARLFPDRADQLTASDLSPWLAIQPWWQKLFAEYDIVQAYATDPILPLLCDKRPYIGYEHGTLRDFPYLTTTQGRVTALGYALADGVFITNGDCITSVPRLHIQHYAPMLHAVDERVYQEIPANAERLHEQFGVKHIFLCTLRHDWSIKGTDVYLRALPGLAAALGRNFKLLLVNWGAQVTESKALIHDLGADDLVHWLEPLYRRKLIRMQKSADALFDQVALPHFGATAPEGIAAGVPVLMSYEPESTAWIVSEPAPILTVWTPEDVVRQAQVALDPDWLCEYRERAHRWSTEQHSYRHVVEGHLAMYRHCLNLYNSPPNGE